MLQSDDMEVGMLVTVMSHKGTPIPVLPSGATPECIAREELALRRYMGAVLLITSVMRPYIIARDVDFHRPTQQYLCRTLDTRWIRLMRVTDDYAEARLGPHWREQVRCAQEAT